MINKVAKTIEMNIYRILKKFFVTYYLRNKIKIGGKC